jgi:hypothetical protein
MASDAAASDAAASVAAASVAAASDAAASDAAASDAAASVAKFPILDLPDELIIQIFELATPFILAQLSQTCRKFRTLAERCKKSPLYAARLAHSLISHCAKRQAWRRPTAAVSAAQTIEAAAAGTPTESLASWEPVGYLRLLYPAATHLPDWPLALYALEWCARREYEILGAGGGARREILALLHPDALEILAGAVAPPDFKEDAARLVSATCWANFTAVQRHCKHVVKKSAQADGCGVFGIAIRAAAYTRYRRRSRWCDRHAIVVREELESAAINTGSVYGIVFSGADLAWLELAGFSGQ